MFTTFLRSYKLLEIERLVFAQAFVSGSTALMHQLMGNRVLHRGPFA